jgi:hypothetical protein
MEVKFWGPLQKFKGPQDKVWRDQFVGDNIGEIFKYEMSNVPMNEKCNFIYFLMVYLVNNMKYDSECRN